MRTFRIVDLLPPIPSRLGTMGCDDGPLSGGIEGSPETFEQDYIPEGLAGHLAPTQLAHTLDPFSRTTRRSGYADILTVLEGEAVRARGPARHPRGSWIELVERQAEGAGGSTATVAGADPDGRYNLGQARLIPEDVARITRLRPADRP